jgi:hypothetical protein
VSDRDALNGMNCIMFSLVSPSHAVSPITLWPESEYSLIIKKDFLIVPSSIVY